MENYQFMTDQELVDRYVSGCNEAFDCLLNRHKDRLYNYIFFAVHNEELANDLFQETFVKAIVTLKQGKYAEKGRFYSWLTRIAHNLIIDHFRQEANVQMLSCEDPAHDLLNNAEVIGSYQEAKIINEQTLLDVRRLMDRLPAALKEVVFMRFYQGLSFKEIAEATGVSINTSLGRMRYALLNMRKMAKEHGISLEMV